MKGLSVFQNIHFVINPGAGQPEPLLHAINQELYDSDVDWRVSVTNKHHSATSLTRQAINDNADLIVAYGGDGTVSSVVNGLVGHDVPLGLLHGGTGNALAYALNIPQSIPDAIKLITGKHTTRALDLGKVRCDSSDSDGYFVLRSSIGLQNRILSEATSDLKERFGNLAYVMAGVRSLSESDKVTFQLNFGEETVEVDGLSCIIANSTAIGGAAGLAFAPQVEPDDGELDVFVLDTRFESLVSAMNSSLGADISAYPNHWRFKHLTITMTPPAVVTLDGEPFAETPAEISVVPGAVTIITPTETNTRGN